MWDQHSIDSCSWAFQVVNEAFSSFTDAEKEHLHRMLTLVSVLIYALSNSYDVQWTCKLFHPCDTYKFECRAKFSSIFLRSKVQFYIRLVWVSVCDSCRLIHFCVFFSGDEEYACQHNGTVFCSWRVQFLNNISLAFRFCSNTCHSTIDFLTTPPFCSGITFLAYYFTSNEDIPWTRNKTCAKGYVIIQCLSACLSLCFLLPHLHGLPLVSNIEACILKLQNWYRFCSVCQAWCS